MGKRAVLNIVKVIAAIAAVVFWLTPLNSGSKVLIFVASLIVLLICAVITQNLDDTQTGYWPPKPTELPSRPQPKQRDHSPDDGFKPDA